MAKQPNIGNLASGFRSSNKLNDNFDEIKEAFNNTISRDGSGPNEMLAPLDMNSKRIINLPAPVDDNEPLRLGDLTVNLEDIASAVLPTKLDRNWSNFNLNTVVTKGTVGTTTLSRFGDNIPSLRFNSGKTPDNTGTYTPLITAVENTLSEGIVSFPSAFNSFAMNYQIGGLAFGAYFEGHTKARNFAAAIEADGYNESGLVCVPSPIWNTAFGYANGPVIVGMTLGASGDGVLNCTTALNISRNGDKGRPWHNGVTIRRDGVLDYGFFQDASSTEGAQWPVHIETPGRSADVAFTVKLKGSQVAGRNLWRLKKASGSETAIDDVGTAIQGGGLMAAFDHFGSLSLGEVGSTPASRLNVHGSTTYASLNNVQATFGVTEDGTNGIGAKLVVGVGAGTGPYIAASKYNTALGTASSLTFITNNTNQIIVPAVGILNAANDAAAAALSVPVNGLYRNGSVLMIRVT